jgi:glycosyltransferase involved in cell wall biosynthesis
VFIATNILNSPETSGPGKFGRRLANELLRHGIAFENIHTADRADLVFISALLPQNIYHLVKSRGRPTNIVMRIDGVGEMAPGAYNADFEDVKWSHEHADYVIYQSYWSRQYVEGHTNCKTEGRIIYNGINNLGTDLTRDITSNEFISICNTWNYVRNENYIPAIVDNFPQIVNAYPSFVWRVVGKYAEIEKIIRERIPADMVEKSIRFSNFPADLHEIRSNAFACIHLVPRDSCPNSLIESMSYGLPSIVWHESAGPELI